MEKAAKGVAPEIITEEIVTEAKEEVKEALAAVWEGASVRSSASGSNVVVGSSLAGMYGAKFQALAKEHEQVRPEDKR
jgi:hypothetical protein